MKKLLALVLFLNLTGCESNKIITKYKPEVHSQSVLMLQHINERTHECWRSDKAFKAYGIIPELDTTATPRILIMPRGKPQALPQLVIVSNGRGVQIFGPLAQSSLNSRIQSDLNAWVLGEKSCKVSV
jgi:hypothetical protein